MEFKKYVRKNDFKEVEALQFVNNKDYIEYVLEYCNDDGEFVRIKNPDKSYTLAQEVWDEEEDCVVNPIANGSFLVYNEKGNNYIVESKNDFYAKYMTIEQYMLQKKTEEECRKRATEAVQQMKENKEKTNVEATMPVSSNDKKGVDQRLKGHYSMKIYENGKPVVEYDGDSPNEEMMKKFNEVMDKAFKNFNLNF